MTTEICLPVNALARLEGALCAGIVTRRRKKFVAFRMNGATVYIPVRTGAARKPSKARTPKRDAALYDTRTAPECWLAGDDRKALHRAHKRAAKGECRSILVRLTDGFECRTSSYLVDDEGAKAEAIRVARSRAMGSCWHDGAVVRAPTGQLTCVREVAAVESVEFVPARSRDSTPIAQVNAVSRGEDLTGYVSRYPSWHPFRHDAAPPRYSVSFFGGDRLAFRFPGMSTAGVERIRRRHWKSLHSRGYRVVGPVVWPHTDLSDEYRAELKRRADRMRQAVATFSAMPMEVDRDTLPQAA